MSQAFEKQWREAIEAVYNVFAAYPRPSGIEASRAEKADQIQRDVMSAPLRELSADHLRQFSGSGIYTAGTESDYKYFLPRILEFMPIDEMGFFEADLIASKLIYAKFQTWATSEVDAIRSVFQAAFLFGFCTRRLDDPTILLRGNLLVGNTPEALLAPILPPSNANAVLNLADLVSSVARASYSKRWLRCNLSEVSLNTVLAWARSEEVGKALSAGSAQLMDEDVWAVEMALAETRFL